MYRMRDIIVLVLLCVLFYAGAVGIVWKAYEYAHTLPAPRVERDTQGIRKDTPRDKLCVSTILQWTRDCNDAVLRHRDNKPTAR